jgi:transcriptional regulator with GAF, ATPase, and Fis domain
VLVFVWTRVNNSNRQFGVASLITGSHQCFVPVFVAYALVRAAPTLVSSLLLSAHCIRSAVAPVERASAVSYVKVVNAMYPKLVAIAGPWKGKSFALTEETNVVGREPESHICLDESAVSRRHCEIACAGDRCTVRDLASHNHTYVNGQPVTTAEIVPGDKLEIGASTFLLVAAGDLAVRHDDESVELRPEDSVYLSTTQEGRGLAPSPRTTGDLHALLRLSTLLHSFRDLHNARGERARDGLARLLLGLLFEMFPAESGAVLLDDDTPGQRFSVVLQRESTDPLMVSRTVVRRVVEHRTVVWVGDAGPDRDIESESLANLPAPMRSVLAAPLVVRGEVAAVLYLQSSNPERRFDENHMQCLGAVVGMAAVAWENASYVEWLEGVNNQLLEELKPKHEMVGSSPKILELQRLIAKVAPSPSTVLILGESGTGKELLARAIHRNSPRANGPFVALNCAALTDTLLESELFGHEKGSFTGAVGQKKGKLEVAAGGTVFLDEIGEMAPLLQAKLLRVLQERQMERVGGTQTVRLDIRMLAATNRDLEEEVRKGNFRQDLYYRLNVVTLKCPALRERTEDIIPLANHFARRFAERCGRPITGIAPAARAYLQSYSWPGNVRELENALERAVVLGSSDTILPEDLPENIREGSQPAEISTTIYDEALNAAKRQGVLKAFDLSNYDHEAASKLLGLHPNYLHRLIRALDLRTALKRAGR